MYLDVNIEIIYNNLLFTHPLKMKNNISPYTINIVLNIFLLLLFITSFIEVDPILSTFTQTYKTVFILIYLLSLSIITYTLILKFLRYKKEQTQVKNNQLKYQRTLSQLNHDEKHILSLFINKQSTENSLDHKNPSVQLLESQKIIFNTSIIDGSKKVYRIEPNIYKLLRSNPNLLY